jgi:F0F1-type ATP synthase membrane subunit b/b'
VVFRRGRGEFIDIQIEREIAADKAEFDRLETEYKQAVGEAKTKLKVKVDAARKRYEDRRELLLKRIEEIEREGEAKIKLLQEQVAKTTDQAKANLEKRVAEERAKHTTRVAKLRQAWQLVKEAVAI